MATHQKFTEKPEDRDLNCRMIAALGKAWALAGENSEAGIRSLLKQYPEVEAGDLDRARVSWPLIYSLTQLRAPLKKPSARH